MGESTELMSGLTESGRVPISLQPEPTALHSILARSSHSANRPLYLTQPQPSMGSDATASASGLVFSIPLTAVHGSRGVGAKRDFDVASSPSQRKKRMLTPPPSVETDLDTASPRTDVSWPSDDEPNELLLLELKRVDNTSQNKTPTKSVKQRTTAFSTAGMSAEAIKQHKAQRRREQVRAASRRCRDRQRKETEDLRTKVFQLEEFIAHTMQSHDWERRQQHQQIQALQQENELLAQELAAASAANVRVDDIEPVPLDSPVNPEDSALPDDLVHCISDEVPRQWSRDLVYHAVEDTTRQLVAMLESQVEPVKSPVIFGWQFDFWCVGDKYYGRNRKFFPGVSALELGKRMQTVDPQRYMETFPEVKKMEVLQVFDDNVLVMRLVKALPGKVFTQAVNVRFLTDAAPPTGSTSRWVYADRTIDEPTDGEYALENECNGEYALENECNGEYALENECNGYVFEDTVQELQDGTRVEGCLAQGVGAFESGGLECSVLLEELAKAFSSVVIRWESLFINDFFPDDADGFADMVLDL